MTVTTTISWRLNSTAFRPLDSNSPLPLRPPFQVLIEFEEMTGDVVGSNSGKHRHPLHEIAESATHKLLLKQWIKEEDLVARRVALRESRVDAVRREIAALYCGFFVFHSLVLLLLYSASASSPSAACRRSWIPCLCSLLCSMAIVWAVRYKTDTECVLERLLEREREDGVLLGKCVEELKRKGAEFDLLKEVDALRRAKSLGVEGKVRKWSARDVATMVLLLLSCVALGLTRFVLCD
ncbi:hypothetical protein B296_00019419 [Ensete ventricosum]|uniref:Uncharacterized protein n=1 Tax=Ensete ventricosum TaxID=4639 RepID=A0A427AEQ6_ENSVE|nr:hypothetical protein B296_00019419 [Ensete ventricosum]